MASFVEQATLRIVDKSTKDIRKVNRELEKLFRTAEKGNRIRMRFDGLDKAQSGVRSLTRDFERLNRPRRLNLNSQEINTALGRARKLDEALNRAARSRTSRFGINQTGAMPGQGLAGQVATPTPVAPGPRRGGRAIVGFGVPGTTTGIGVAGMTAAEAALSITALTVGTLTVRTLVAESMNASRLDLQTESMTTTAQREALQRQDPVGRDAPVTQRELQALRAGFIADVRNDDPDITAAGAAAVADRSIESARLLAEARAISFQEAFDLVQRDLAKAVDLATGDIVDGAGKFNARAEAVWRAFEDALIVNPDLDSRTIRTATAGTQSGRGTMSAEAFFDMAVLASASGQRIGNAWNRAMQNLSGNQREISNEKLAELGLFDAEAGQAIDQDLLNQNLNAWLTKNLFPALETKIRADFDAEGIVNPTAEQMRSRMATEVRPLVGRENAAAVINELFIAMDAIQRQRQQVEELRISSEERAARRLANFATQVDVTSAKFRDTMQEVGDAMGTTLLPAIVGVGDVLHGLNQMLREGTITPGQVVTGGAVATGAAVTGAQMLWRAAFAPLNASAVALDGSAVALTNAARALGGAGVVDGGVGPTRGRASRIGTPGGVNTSAVGKVMAFTTAIGIATEVLHDFGRTGDERIAQMQANAERSQAFNEKLEGMLPGWFNRMLKWDPFGTGDGSVRIDGVAPVPAEKVEPSIAELRAEIERLTTEIAAARSKQVIPGFLDPAGVGAKEDRIADLQQQIDAREMADFRAGLAEWDAIVQDNRTAIAAEYDNGAMKVEQGISNGAQSASQQMASTLGASFQQGADLLAGSILRAIQNASVNVRADRPALVDTGAMVPD